MVEVFDLSKKEEPPAREFRLDPKCHVCAGGDGALELVNNLLLNGSTYAAIVDAVASINMIRPKNRRITVSVVSRHARLHMPVKAAAVRRIVEKHAEQARKDFENGVEAIVTAAAYAETMMNLGYQNMVEGRSPVSAKEGLEAAKTLHGFMKEEENNQTAAQAYAQLNVIIESIKNVCTPEQIQAIVDGTKQLPQGNAGNADQNSATSTK